MPKLAPRSLTSRKEERRCRSDISGCTSGDMWVIILATGSNLPLEHQRYPALTCHPDWYHNPVQV